MYNLVPKKKAKAFKQQEKAGPFIYLFIPVCETSYQPTVSNPEEPMPPTTVCMWKSIFSLELKINNSTYYY